VYGDVKPLTDAPPDADARQQVTALFEAHALGLVKLAKVMLGDQALAGLRRIPNGQQLAVLSVRGNGTTLRVYSVASGATLRTWTAGTWKSQAYVHQFPGVSWTADSRQVA
jgi:hypothetical protein